MVYGKKKRVSKKLYKRKYKVSVGKLLDSKINTALERRMVEVAQKEARSHRVSLCKREILYGEYDRETHTFKNFKPVDWKGRISYLSDLRAVDIATMANQAQADDPDTMVDEASEALGDGTNVLMPNTPIDGRRDGQHVLVTGCDIKIKARIVPGEDFDENIQTQDLQHQNIKIKFGIYRVSADWDNLLGAGVPNEPKPREVQSWRPWSYTASLDNLEDARTNINPKRVCCEGELTITQNEYSNAIRGGYARVRFKKPQLLKFAVGDQAGKRPIKYKYFTVVRANCSTGLDTFYKPHICVMSRLFYELE